MSETTWSVFLKNLSLICNWLGLLIAVLFLFGPKVLIIIGKFLDTPRKTVQLDRILANKSRIILGITLLVVTGLMLILVTNLPV